MQKNEQPIIGNKGLAAWLGGATVDTVKRYRRKYNIKCHHINSRVICFYPSELNECLRKLFIRYDKANPIPNPKMKFSDILKTRK